MSKPLGPRGKLRTHRGLKLLSEKVLCGVSILLCSCLVVNIKMLNRKPTGKNEAHMHLQFHSWDVRDLYPFTPVCSYLGCTGYMVSERGKWFLLCKMRNRFAVLKSGRRDSVAPQE